METLDNLSPRVTSGRLFVSVIECTNLQPSPGYYCTLAVEHQQVQTSTIPVVQGSVQWNQSVNFDVSNPASNFTLTVWSKGQGKTPTAKVGSCTQSIGQLVPNQEHQHRAPISLDSTIELWFKMTQSLKPVSLDDFVRLKTIGKGSFGTVYLVKKRDTGNLFAMKVILKQTIVEKNAVMHTINERKILKQIDHPFIVNLKYAFQTDDHLFMVMPYMNGGELFFHLSEGDDLFGEERTKFYVIEIITALGYMHDNGIFYRDLKPENILLDMEGHVSIVDFGLSKMNMYFGDTTSTFCGSLEYMPPEVLLGLSYSLSIDWWALATMTYEMISGLPPFWAEDQNEMIDKLCLCDIEQISFDLSLFSEESVDFIKKVLVKEPERRLGYGPHATDDIKAHPWFSDVDWARVYNKQIIPPFRPHVKGEYDMRYFDEQVLSLDPSKLDLRKLDDKNGVLRGAFDDFNFEDQRSPHHPHCSTPRGLK